MAYAPDPVATFWIGTAEVLPGVTLIQTGGHFPGSAVALWPAGAYGRGVLLTGDTLMTSPDGRWASFMRSYVNYIPLSAPVVERLADTLKPYAFDRLYDSFGGVVPTNGKQAVRRSADRYTGWLHGDFDADT